jgi:hypothetical protein
MSGSTRQHPPSFCDVVIEEAKMVRITTNMQARLRCKHAIKPPDPLDWDQTMDGNRYRR